MRESVSLELNYERIGVKVSAAHRPVSTMRESVSVHAFVE